MYIRQIEIFGFKSFKDKTILEFDNHDITGIVGPNGCGKSNILDAILWVMGENSPKNLRGESLSDIIFGGTSKEAAGNLVEVKLILSRGDKNFPPGYTEFSEVMITRRSFRGGKSECFINDKECLLRDIREFFMNTGAGCKGFSIIEQESIEKLISAKPLQRRFIIEEAAGITKFNNQKSEAIRKLQLVDQNLTRLDDILKFQDKQLNDLHSQAKKAEKYKKLKLEIESREKQIYSSHYKVLQVAQSNIEVEMQKNSEQQKQQEENLLQNNQNLQKTGEEIKVNQKQSEEIQKKLTEKKMEEASLKDKAKTFEMIKSIKHNMNTLKQSKHELKIQLIAFKDVFKDNDSLSFIQEETLKAKTYLDESKQNKNSLLVHVDLLTKQTEFVEKEITSLRLEEKHLQESIKQNINDKNQKRELIQKEKSNQILTEKNFIELNKKEKELLDKKLALEQELNSLKPEVFALTHKIEEMKKLLTQFETINKGAEDLVKWQPEQFHSLFQYLNIENKYTKALSVVLGPWIQAIVPEELSSLELAVERLKNTQKGKSWFLTRLPQAEVSVDIKQKLKIFPAFICFLDEKIDWNLHNSALKPLLEQTLVVSNFKSALELKKQFPSFQFVTLDGDLITRDSVVYAGSPDQESSLFEIRNQVEESIKSLATQTVKLKAREIEWSSCLKQVKEIESRKHGQQKILNGFLESFNMAKKDIEFIEKDLLRLAEMRERTNKKIKDFNEKQENLLEHEVVFHKDIKKQEDNISLKQAYLKVLQLALANNKELQSLEQEEALLLNVINQSKNSAQTLSSLELENEIQKNQDEKQNLEQQLQHIRKELDKNFERKNQSELDIKTLEESIFESKLNTNSLVGEKDKKGIEKTHVKDKFMEAYQVHIEDYKSQTETPLEDLKTEVSRFQEQLARIKQVNFLALEEYESLFQDNQFLTQQKEDLLSSQQGILKVINHIDKICKTRFNDMLIETNKRFSRIFPIVFQGDNAKAELILHEENGEQGVDILVHPPGKKPQSVGLLSRGEKALTSVCLIYSLFLVKPSPFCIIDEADAPLDDANIFRFLSVLKEMSRNSQIIVITHNKYTMQNCCKLYGITQKQPGVSQIVSVNMEQNSQNLAPEL